MDEDERKEVPHVAVVEESNVVTSASPVDVVEVSVSTVGDPVIVPSGSCMSTSSPGEAHTVPEKCGLEVPTGPCASIVGVSAVSYTHLTLPTNREV